MRTHSLRHLSDRDLVHGLVLLDVQDRDTLVARLAYLAEVDARRLYVPAGYPSMYTYCVHELHLTEDGILKRIRAARTARRFPIVFDALADGRLSFTAVVLLGPHLNRENADDLLKAAENKTKCEIQELLARRFPRSELLPMVMAIPQSSRQPSDSLVPEPVEKIDEDTQARVGEFTDQLVPEPVETAVPRSRLAPHATDRFGIQFTMSRATYDKLQYAQALLSHAVPSGDVAEVFDRALDALNTKLEKRKFAATDRPREGQRRSAVGKRTIPAHVRRAVLQRDGGQCTFVGEGGHRCASRKFLEFDHVDPVARGGQSTVENMRLRCRAHNQYEAERVFGAGFLGDRRDEARRAAAARAEERAAAKARAADEARAAMEAKAAAAEVIPWLRQLGLRADEARRAAARCEIIPDASLDQRVRVALSFFGSKPQSAMSLAGPGHIRDGS